MMTTHAARIAKLAEMFRAEALSPKGWVSLKLGRIGEVRVHVMSQDSCKEFGYNEVWARMGSSEPRGFDHEFRGTAEKVAAELCKLLKAPSKAVAAAADVILSKKFDSLREPEMAAIYNLDEETTFKAMAFLEERGVAVNKGDLGWFRTVAS